MGSTSEVDICIVGAGVAGALIAYHLGQAGYTVAVLESGPRYSYPDMDRYGVLLRGGDPWPWFRQDLDDYEDLAEPALLLNSNRIKAVGGTTLHWNGNAQRLQPGDFKMRTLFGVAEDWPFEYADLEPWYQRAEEEIGVCGDDAPGQPPRSAPFPLPAFDYSHVERNFVMPAFERMGLPMGANSAAINSRARDGRPGCAVFSTCIPMCPIHARYTGLHHVQKAEATGRVEIRSDCHVRRLRVDQGRRVGAVQFVGADGREHEVTARQFVLAGGGVENPRILQLSASLNAGTEGLANSSGLLGRTFMSHSRIIVRGRLPEKFGPHRNGYATTNCWGLYQHDRLPEIGNIMLSPDPNNGPTPATIARRSRAWGHDLLDAVKREHGQELDIHVKGDMLPLPENRVRLSTRHKDRFGDPIPAVEIRLAEFDRRTLDYGAEVAKQLFSEMGATEITGFGYGIMRNHLMGTTRMGRSPASSVCDEWGRCHDLDNLYIAGGSLFATAGCSSPTLTIAALALRTADYLDRAVL